MFLKSGLLSIAIIHASTNLKVLHDLGLVERLDTGKHPGVGDGILLLRWGKLVKFTSGEGLERNGENGGFKQGFFLSIWNLTQVQIFV